MLSSVVALCALFLCVAFAAPTPPVFGHKYNMSGFTYLKPAGTTYHYHRLL